MSGSKAATPDTPAALPTGGMWNNQIMFGGLRLDQEFKEKEQFILFDLSSPGEVVVGEEDGIEQKADKTLLTVARLDDPSERFEVGTLGKAIREMVDRVQDGDLPVVCYWEKVETKRALQPATVITAVRPWAE